MNHTARYMGWVVETLAADATLQAIVGTDSQKGVYKNAAPMRDAASSASPKMPYVVCTLASAPAATGNGGNHIATRPLLVVRIYGGTGDNRKSALDQIDTLLAGQGTQDGATIAPHVKESESDGIDSIPGEPAVPYTQARYRGFVTG